ncbi:restriction endonuclease subunit S [Escherichia coli]|uniref:restriction endonuclease subunit S n=5 Tax=Enterobacteriaceae TaxID=543 RepID=UPI0001F078FB|nr:restriction endonuclease subunit S [Escherichia coli]EFU98942.1 type I restriction modification DNA specificity domain protein [Escherichia coli 3431]
MQDVSEDAQLKNNTQLPFKEVKSGFTYFEKGDVLLAKITPCFENGKGCHTADLPTNVGFGSTEFHVLRENEDSDSRFIYFWTTDKKFRASLESEMVGSAGHRRVPLVAIEKYLIPCPPNLQEQSAIADSLSDINNFILALEKLIVKKQAIKTATMQRLLTGKTRLPQFALRKDGSAKGYKKSELGEIPEDWVVTSIGQFTDCCAGGTPSTKISAYWGGTHPWMSSGELHLKQVYAVADYITDEGLVNSSTKYVPKNSVLVGLAGQGKTRGTVAINRIELCTNQSIAAIFPSKHHSTEFLFYNLDSRYEELRSLSTGDGGRGGLNLTIIRKLHLAFPPKEEQTAIATILSDMDKEIQTLQQRLDKTRQLKQGMMQELLTGKTRLI